MSPKSEVIMRKISFVVSLLLVLGLVLVLAAWRNVSGGAINPRYVEKIKDGQTTKNEIMVLFGDPQEIKKTDSGVVYIYKSFKDASGLPYNPDKRQPNPQSNTPFLIDEDKKIKKVQDKPQPKAVHSTLTIYFKPDSQTVSGHEFVEK